MNIIEKLLQQWVLTGITLGFCVSPLFGLHHPFLSKLIIVSLTLTIINVFFISKFHHTIIKNKIIISLSIYTLFSIFFYLNSSKVDICRCLTEPGNTKWFKDNEKKCDKLINAYIGSSNWKDGMNDSQTTKWNELKSECVLEIY